MRLSPPATPDEDPTQVVNEFWDYFEDLLSRRNQQLAATGKPLLTWKELAYRFDISDSTLNDWRHKRVLPANSTILVKMAVFLGGGETDCQARWRKAREAYGGLVTARQAGRKPDNKGDHGHVENALSLPSGTDGLAEDEATGRSTPEGGVSTSSDGAVRRRSPRRVLLALAGALTVVLVSLFTPLHTWVGKHLLHTGSAVSPALTVTAEPVTLEDQGNTMATADGHRPSQQVLHQVSQSGVAASAKFLQELRSDGGVNVEASTVQLIVNGLSREGVRIMDIRPVALRRTAPLSGTLYLLPSQAGNATIRMMFDLDELNPLARQDASADNPAKGDPRQQLAGFIIGVHPGNPFFDAETIHLAYHEQQVINVRMQVTRFYAKFDLEIDYIIGTESGVVHKIIVTDDGHPFTITGIPPGHRAGTATYQEAFQLQGNFSLCQISDPGQIPLGATAPPPPCLQPRKG